MTTARQPPRLRVRIGPSLDELRVVKPNTGTPYEIRSEAFEGRVVIHIKGLVGDDGTLDCDSEYFGRPERKGCTWSVQVQGRFLQERSANAVVFGNTFDRPLRLPWGSSAALKFMNFIDPTLENDLMGPAPWALSPLVSTMPYFAHKSVPPEDPLPEFPIYESIQDDTSQLRPRSTPVKKGARSEDPMAKPTLEPPLNLGPPNKRRTWFSSASHREAIVYGPSDVITTDFCYGFLSFPALSLNLPGGISFDLMKYWDGQPVRFVCCERADDDESSDSGTSEELQVVRSRTRAAGKKQPKRKAGGPGRIFWCVVFEVVPDDE